MSSVQTLVSPSRRSPSGLETVLQTVALTKTYRMGEVDVHALAPRAAGHWSAGRGGRISGGSSPLAPPLGRDRQGSRPTHALGRPRGAAELRDQPSHNHGRILPEHQRLEVGQALDRAGNMLVKACDHEHFLVLGPPDSLSEVESTWTLGLYPIDGGRIRLVSRVRARVAPTVVWCSDCCSCSIPGSSSWSGGCCSGSSRAPSALGRGDVRCQRSARP